jgi:hypothetical protein
MTGQKLFINRAIQELLNPLFETTVQYLEVLQLEIINGQPAIARVNQTTEFVWVYFIIKGERFFLVITLTNNDNPKVLGTWVESGHRVYLTATSKSKSYDELASYINLKPLTGWTIGERPNWKGKPNDFSRIRFEPIENEAYDLNEKLLELLTAIENDRQGILRLTENSAAVISVCRHQYISGNAGIHFDIETINRLQKLNLPIDIDTYIVGNKLKD